MENIMKTFVSEATVVFDSDVDNIRNWWNSNNSLIALCTNVNVKSFDEMNYTDVVHLTTQTSDLMKRILSYYTS